MNLLWPYVDCYRKNANDTVALQLRTEDLTYDLSELNSMNADLRKQLHTADNLKSPTIKHKIEVFVEQKILY